jgi:hypothetical protein
MYVSANDLIERVYERCIFTKNIDSLDFYNI